MEYNWYAVYTKPRWEKKVAELLLKRKFESYCPTNLVVRQWSDRKKKIQEPLFTSYVFVRATEKQLSEVKQVIGIINLVYWLNKPAIIKDYEIESIKAFIENYKTVTLEKVRVNVNDKVRVINGLLADYVGEVLEVRSNSVKVVLPSLGYMMIAEVERSNVEVYNYSVLPSHYHSMKYA